MATLTNTKIKDTYPALLKATDNGELSATEKVITDGVGNNSTLSLGTNSATVAGTLAFGSLKDSGENITITKFVDEADGIASNDNDTTIPTSAAVKNYVDNAVPTEADTLDSVTDRGNTTSNTITVGKVRVETGSNTVAIDISNGGGEISSNIAVGTSVSSDFFGSALTSNTTGSNNIAIGNQALLANTTGSNNLALGAFSLLANTTSSFNVAIGMFSLRANTSGSNNVAIGYDSGDELSIGDNNVYIGFNTTASEPDASNEVVIGANATGNGNNTVTYGDSNITKHIFTSGNVGIGESSPASRLIVKDTSGSNNGIRIHTADSAEGFVIFRDDTATSPAALYYDHSVDEMWFKVNGSERMRITSGGEVYIAGTTDRGAYNLQCNGTGVWGQGAYVNGSDIRFKEEIKSIESGLDVVEKLKPVSYKYKKEFSRDVSTQAGFIAQDLQEALKGKEYLDGIVKSDSEYLSVAYQSLIPILTKAIQELKAEIETLKVQING